MFLGKNWYALSPLLFVVVVGSHISRIQSCKLLYADDLVVMVETESDLMKRLNEWKDNADSRGMRVNIE